MAHGETVVLGQAHQEDPWIDFEALLLHKYKLTATEKLRTLQEAALKF